MERRLYNHLFNSFVNRDLRFLCFDILSLISITNQHNANDIINSLILYLQKYNDEMDEYMLEVKMDVLTLMCSMLYKSNKAKDCFKTVLYMYNLTLDWINLVNC